MSDELEIVETPNLAKPAVRPSFQFMRAHAARATTLAFGAEAAPFALAAHLVLCGLGLYLYF